MKIPYQVNKSKLIEKIAETVKNNIIEGISDLEMSQTVMEYVLLLS